MSGNENQKENAAMRKLINRLIQWMEAHGMSDKLIKDCIKLITQDK